jgi:hypothetical protein
LVAVVEAVRGFTVGAGNGVTLPFVVPTTATVFVEGKEFPGLIVFGLPEGAALASEFICPATTVPVFTGGTNPAPGEPALGKTVPC